MSERIPDTAAAADPLVANPAPVLEYLSAPSTPGQTMKITGRTLEILRQTFPWATVIAGLMCVGGALIAFTGLYMLAAGGQPFAAGAIVAVGLSLAAPSVFLSRYATYMREFVHTADGQPLEKAFESSWMFWKILAIAAIVMVMIAVVGLLSVPGVIRMQTLGRAT